tara:strand:+ start:1451 stop:1684 length:234 start_codon:yes stop_codon:yes gene_type:complete
MFTWATNTTEKLKKELPKHWKEDLTYLLKIEGRCEKNVIPTKYEMKIMNNLHKHYSFLAPLIGQTWADRPKRYERAL